MEKKRIYLLIENTKRELDAKIYLAIVAARNNWSVIICSKSNFLKQIKNFKKGIVFLKSVGVKNEALVNKGRELGFSFVSTDEEGINFFNEQRLMLRMSGNIYNGLISFFSWGKKDALVINKNHPEQKHVNYIVGNPRIDVLKHPLNKKYMRNAEKIKNKYGNFILLASNFGKVIKSTKTDWVSDFIKAGLIKTDDEIKLEKDAVNFEKENMNEFIMLTKELCLRFPTKNFIFRPHPTEDLSFWEKALKNLKNLKINTDTLSTNNFTMASDLLIASNCFTNTESFFLGKNSINFVPFRDDRFEFELIKLTSQNINNIPDILNIVEKEKYKENQKKNESTIKFIQELIHNSHEIDSAEEMVKIINKINFNFLDSDKDKNIPKTFFFVKIKSYLLQIYNFIKVYYYLYIKKDDTLYQIRLVALNKRDSISNELINETIQSYLEFKGYEKNISSFELYKGLFCVQKEK